MVKKGSSSLSAGTLKSPSTHSTSKPEKDKDDTEKKTLPNKSHKGGALRQFLSKRDLKILKQAKLQGGDAWEAAKAKVRLKLAPAEYKSKSARANTAMPVKKLKRRLQESVPKNRRVTTEAGVALAAVLDYAVSELVDNACQAAELKRARTIIPRHIKLGVPQDESLAELFRGVTIPQGGTVPTFHPELAQGYKRRATRPRMEAPSKELSSPGYGESKGKKDLSEAKPGSSGEETSHDSKKDKPGASSSSPAEK